MSVLKPMDERFPIQQQLGIDADAAVLVNLFTMAPEDEATFLGVWTEDAAIMKLQPGFISTQLHRAVGPSPTYLNYAVWQSTAHFRDAFANPAFRDKLGAYPASAVGSPHLFQKVAVDGICLA